MKTVSTELLEVLNKLPSVIAHNYVAEAVPSTADPKPLIQNPAKPIEPVPKIMTIPQTPVIIEQQSGANADALDQLANEIKGCTLCGLSQHRSKAIVGTGSLHPLVMVIGEMPGLEDDKLGLPFIGAAGQFLDKWLESIGLSRYTNVFMAYVVRCKTPENRSPLADEIGKCQNYLVRQISLLNPKALMTIGDSVASQLLGKAEKTAEIRGQVFSFNGIPWMPFYHPSTVLRDPELKRPVWEDLKVFKQLVQTGGK